MSYSTQNKSFWRHSFQPISSLGNEENKVETKSQTTKSGLNKHRKKHKMLNLNKNTKKCKLHQTDMYT